MAVPMESEFITQFFSASFTFRSDMIDLYLISVSDFVIGWFASRWLQ